MNRISKKKLKSGKRVSSKPVPEQINFDQRTPVFSLRHLSGGHCISQCENKDQLSFVDKIRIISQFTWAQIKNQHRHATGFEKLSRNAFNVGIPSHITEDQTLIAFRFSGKKPMVGYRDRDIFHIIWFDNDFSVYDHGN